MPDYMRVLERLLGQRPFSSDEAPGYPLGVSSSPCTVVASLAPPLAVVAWWAVARMPSALVQSLALQSAPALQSAVPQSVALQLVAPRSALGL